MIVDEFVRLIILFHGHPLFLTLHAQEASTIIARWASIKNILALDGVNERTQALQELNSVYYVKNGDMFIGAFAWKDVVGMSMQSLTPEELATAEAMA